MPLEIGGIVTGEVVDIPSEGILIHLPEDQIGLVPVCESLPAETIKVRFHIGERVTVRIVGKTEDGRFNLSILPPKQSESANAFDQEFHLLSTVLRSRPANLGLKKVPCTPLVEEGIKEWVNQAGQAIHRLRRHRAKRLSEPFYDEESKGEPHSKRNRHHR